jgi:S1-C subfamily serine protease
MTNTICNRVFLFVSVFLFASGVCAQERTTTLNIFVPSNTIGLSAIVNVYLNDELAGGVRELENIQCKLFSKGRITITISYPEAYIRKTSSIDVERGKTYYLKVTSGYAAFNTTEASFKEFEPEITRTLKYEEEYGSAVVRSTNTDDDAPKQGTCFVIDSKGYLLTNAHVVEGRKEITINGIDGDFVTKYGATVVAIDKSCDLALLKVSNKNVVFKNPPYSIRSYGIAQAEKVYALGFPVARAMGEEVKVTEGIISAKTGIGNDVSNYQISAAVNPGNSGGPLIDEKGNLIGVIYAKSTVAESAGYAIKAGYVETFLKNVEGFQLPVLVNTIKDKQLTDKIAELKNYIFIIEAK